MKLYLSVDIEGIAGIIHTAPVTKGIGASNVSVAPSKARSVIREGIKKALGSNFAACRTKLAPPFEIEVTYGDPHHAYVFSWYPGAKHAGKRTVKFAASNFFEIKRFLSFAT